jgi:hypothetical protein
MTFSRPRVVRTSAHEVVRWIVPPFIEERIANDYGIKQLICARLPIARTAWHWLRAK